MGQSALGRLFPLRQFGGICLLTFGLTLAGLAQPGTGTIAGTVADESGRVLPGVEVRIRNEGTAAVRSVVSNDSGIYRIPPCSRDTTASRPNCPGSRPWSGKGWCSRWGRLSPSISPCGWGKSMRF